MPLGREHVVSIPPIVKPGIEKTIKRAPTQLMTMNTLLRFRQTLGMLATPSNDPMPAMYLQTTGSLSLMKRL